MPCPCRRSSRLHRRSASPPYRHLSASSPCHCCRSAHPRAALLALSAATAASLCTRSGRPAARPAPPACNLPPLAGPQLALPRSAHSSPRPGRPYSASSLSTILVAPSLQRPLLPVCTSPGLASLQQRLPPAGLHASGLASSQRVEADPPSSQPP
jgi:hypothetical protein